MPSKRQAAFVIGIVAVLIVATITAAIVTTGNKSDTGKVRIVTSFYPLSYMAKEIGGDRVDVKSLIPENTEVHSWSPSASDILNANKADIFVYNGAGLEPWVENQLLPSMDTSRMTVVETTHGLELVEPAHDGAVRLFVFDNDNKRTLVYDVEDGNAMLVGTMPFGVSGAYNVPQVRTDDGGVYLVMPNLGNITVVDSGLHGEHFHDPEVVTVIPAGKPVHYDVSADSKYIAWALDTDQKVLVIPVNAPGNYQSYADGSTNTSSHSTVLFDKTGPLYIGEMRTPSGQNLRIINASNGNILVEGDNAGKSPHGGSYSNTLGKAYFNCVDGLAVASVSGYEKTIPYSHTGNRIGSSVINENGTWLIATIPDASQGLRHAKLLVYDLVSESLVMEMPLNVTNAPQGVMRPDALFLTHHSVMAIPDPTGGKVLLVDVVSGEVQEVVMPGQFPQTIRLIDDSDNGLWAVTADGYAHFIDVDHAEIEFSAQLEIAPGVNYVVAAVPAATGDHGHEEEGHDHGLTDPHSWISPFIAKQQAEKIFNALVQRDPNGTAYYTERWNALKQKLIDLDDKYMAELEGKGMDHIFVSHSAYGYLADRYGFHQVGVIGISADEQPSASALSAMVNKMVETGTYTLYLDPVYSDVYVQTLKTNVESKAGHTVQILRLYLMTGSVDGKDYLQQMEANLENLKIGLDA